MSASNPQKLKRNVSPSTNRQGPLRATKQFGLGFVNTSSASSPSRKHSAKKAQSSPIGSKGSRRSLSETGFVTDRRSPTSPSFKVEKPKALHGGYSGSLESISFYLSGQWPKDHVIQGRKPDASKTHSYFCKDVQTQTPDEWEEVDKNRQMLARFSAYKKPNAEPRGLKPKEIKQKLQRKEIRGAPNGVRYSPVPVFQGSSSQPVRIPTPPSQAIQLRGTPGKQRASVEGHNQEIEKLIVAATSKLHEEEGLLIQNPMENDSYLDGRRAPVYDLLNMRSIDTQTPSQREPIHARPPFDSTGSQVDSESIFLYRPDSRASTDTDHENSRPQSVSPSFIGGAADLADLLNPLTVESPPVQSSSLSTKPTSPRPNSEFVRSPPDGAEKIKMADEWSEAPRMKHFLFPRASAVSFQPSERSAFQSLHTLSQTASH